LIDENVKPDEIISPRQRKINHERLYAGEPILKIERLSKQFGSFTALEKASFQVFPGETLGIVGESGSGKTTLARVVLELIPASEGRILYQDLDITKLTAGKLKKLRKDLQIIFQDPYSSLNPRLAIGPAILEPMKVHGLHGNEKGRKARVMDLLQKVGLNPEHFYRYPHEFSGGQRQRICIARALAVEPRLVICDESVSALDVSIQAQVLNLLNDLKKDFGLTYIFISHDLSVVKFMSDRLIVMKNGKIEEMGEADEVYANPRSEYTRALLEAIPGKRMTSDE
jgi:peptide/nickel transport system ATP-binding protein